MGKSAQLTAWAVFADGFQGQVDALWSSSAPEVASVDPRGMVFAHAPGQARITAALDAVRAEAAVSVVPVTVARYDLTGRVVNQNGKPVAAVRVGALDGEAAGRETLTGWDGRYFLDELRGETTIAARKDGYAEQSQLATGPPAVLNFTLAGRGPVDSFGDGQWLVVDEIMARRYFGDPRAGCIWQRRSGFSDLGGTDRAATSPPDPDFIAEGFFNFDALQEIVDIHETDALFRSTPECGDWVPVPHISAIQDNVGPGSWLVGAQIAPGTYRADADEFCYWARLQSFGGTEEEILDDGFVEAPGEVTVVIEGPDVGFFTDDECGLWTRVDEGP